MESDLTPLVAPLLPAGQNLQKIEKLFGEASYREYFRVFTPGGQSHILMKLPPGKQSVSEEITNYEGPKDEPPFLNVARYLAEQRLPVPQVLNADLPYGLILLQDLGDKSLEKLLKNCNEPMRLFFYQQAVDLLLDLQETGERHRDERCMAFHRSFDAHLLLWEFDHFLEYGIEDRFGISIPAEKKQEIQYWAGRLVDSITDIPYGLTHRDFQSRNLMLYGYQFYMIDFQDALLGPPQYDLVALLRDSYVDLPPQMVDSLIDYYLTQREKRKLFPMDPGAFRRHFFEITLQRKLKDTGRFQFIKTVKNNPNFLPYVPNSLKYVRDAFTRLPEYQPLQEKIADFVPELR
jgi:hypothetical protein